MPKTKEIPTGMILNFIKNKVWMWAFRLRKRTMPSEEKQTLVPRTPNIIGSRVRKAADDKKVHF